MATELHTEELKNATDKHITNICLKLSLLQCFSYFKVTETTKCKRQITEDEIQKVLKKTNTTLWINSLPV